VAPHRRTVKTSSGETAVQIVHSNRLGSRVLERPGSGAASGRDGRAAPRLRVVKLAGSDQSGGTILTPLHVPLNADWQPKPQDS
jgi:hypothetical protein